MNYDDPSMQEFLRPRSAEEIMKPPALSQMQTSSFGDDFQEDDFIEEGNTEGILEKIGAPFKNALQASIPALNFIPKSGAEAMDLPKVAYNALGGGMLKHSLPPLMAAEGLSKTFGLGSPAGAIDEWSQPKTEFGKQAGQTANTALMMSTAPSLLNLAKGGAKGIGGMFDLAGAKRGLSGTVRKGAMSAEGSIGKMMQGASDEMGAGLQAIGDTGVDASHIRGLLDKVATVLDEGGSTFGNPNSAAGQILRLKEGLPVTGNFTGPQLQAKYIEIKDALGKIGPASSKAQWALGEHFKEILPDSMKGIREAMSGAYKKGNLAKPLTKRGTLNQIAKGTMDDELLAELQSASKQVPGLEELIAQITGAGKKVRRVGATRTAGKLAGGGALGLMGLNFLRSLMGGASNVTNIYQGGE